VTALSIPVIDIAPYRAGDPAGTKRVAEAVGTACEQIGFLMLAKLERRETRAAG
jgi:isopenicillin N synthase-like dioxygenase